MESRKAAADSSNRTAVPPRDECRDTVSVFQREVRDGLDVIEREYHTRLRYENPRPGIEDEFMSEVRRKVTRAPQAFNQQLADVERNFMKKSTQNLMALHAVATPAGASTGGRDPSVLVGGSRALEFFGKIVGGLGQAATGAFSVISAGVFAGAIVGGAGTTAAAAAAASAVPVAGWVIAAALVGAGAYLKRRARTRIRTALLAEFTRVVDDMTKSTCDAFAADANSRCERRIGEAQEHIGAATEQKSREVEQLEARLAASAESKARFRTAIRDRIARLKGAIQDIEGQFRMVEPQPAARSAG
jgi:hypothetical protein